MGKIRPDEGLPGDHVAPPLPELRAEEGSDDAAGDHQGNRLAGLRRAGRFDGGEAIVIGEALVAAEQEIPGDEQDEGRLVQRPGAE